MRWHRSLTGYGYLSCCNNRMTSRPHHQQFRIAKLLTHHVKHSFAERTGEALLRAK
jgi:hypothetical protein